MAALKPQVFTDMLPFHVPSTKWLGVFNVSRTWEFALPQLPPTDLSI